MYWETSSPLLSYPLSRSLSDSQQNDTTEFYLQLFVLICRNTIMAQCMCLCVFLSISLLFSTPVSWTQFLFPLAMPTPLLSIKNTHYNQNHPLVNPRQISHPLPRLSLSCPITRHYIRDNYYRKLVYYWQSLCHPFNNNITSTCAVAHCACRGFDKYACTFIHTYIIQNHKHIHTHTHTQNGGRGDDVSLFSPIFYLFYRGPLPPTEQ